ncbi:hypothetical protein TNCT_705581 [Trichonephila clavata]|uniref:Secreted protein n=1 Tax=Trichonephila clavata TaxID=2740835 RepID=A0A8X6GIP5_TRICU|nr:hypothetical protein TNCT_705581 [Trichonephila clavata]
MLGMERLFAPFLGFAIVLPLLLKVPPGHCSRNSAKLMRGDKCLVSEGLARLGVMNLKEFSTCIRRRWLLKRSVSAVRILDNFGCHELKTRLC